VINCALFMSSESLRVSCQGSHSDSRHEVVRFYVKGVGRHSDSAGQAGGRCAWKLWGAAMSPCLWLSILAF
jgi:hypothetical protein